MKASIFGTLARIIGAVLIGAFALTFAACGDESDSGGGDITYTATADSTANTTGITLTFSNAVTGLTVSDITIANGTGIVTKGDLTGSGTSWSLGVTVEAAGNITVSISKSGIEAAAKTVTVYRQINIVIGIAMPEPTIERWVKDGLALKEAALAKGYQVESPVHANNQNEQNAQIQTLMNNGARLIIVGHIDTGIVPVIEEAKQKGVTIIAYDRLIQGTGDYDYYITFNNYKVGEMMGQSIVDALGAATKNIALFAGSQDDKNAEFFFNGAWNILNGKGYTVIEGNTLSEVGISGWYAPNAKTRMDTIFNNNTIDAVLAPNDSVARYIIDNYPSFTGIITGQDAEFQSALYIKDGKQYMTVFKDTRVLAKAAVELADRILQEQPINNIDGVILATGDLTEMGNTGVKKVETYLADPKVIKKANLNDLLGIGWFTPAEEIQFRSDAHRWSKWVDETSTATVVYSVDSDGVCTITVGGTAELNQWDHWKANAGYRYTANANTSYEYTFEAWTASGEGNRTLNIQYYYDEAESVVDKNEDKAITATRTTYTIQGESLPKGGDKYLRFRCADQTGTFYVKILSITEYTP